MVNESTSYPSILIIVVYNSNYVIEFRWERERNRKIEKERGKKRRKERRNIIV